MARQQDDRQPFEALDGRRQGLLHRLRQHVPGNLQEFGYVVGDPKAVDTLIESYWKPLWQWSSRVAVSGEGVEKCIFRDIIK